MDELTPITLKPSRWTLWLHRSVALLAALALFSCGLNLLLKSSLLLLLLLLVWRHEQGLRVNPIDAIGVAQSAWWIQCAGQKILVQRSGDAVVLPWLIVLPLRAINSHADCSLSLWPDSLHKEDARRLRVFLRYH